MTAGNDQARATQAPAIQIRRAWLVLGAASLTFALLVASVIAAATWIYRNATEPETASLTVVSGTGALVRSPGDTDWRLVSGDVTVREGDRVSTALGTVITLEFFDGSTVEVTEDTIVRIARVRSSRFLKRTKLIVLEPERGTIYVAMSPRGEYGFSEITTRIGELRVTMSDEAGRNDTGSYLVEVLDDPPGATLAKQPVRAAVLYGVATVRRSEQSVRLEANQQTVVAGDGTFGEVSTVVRELVVNGDFSHGLSGWIEYEQESQRHTGDSGGTLVELAQDETTLGESVVVELIKAGNWDDVAQVGIRQRIGKTLRVHTSLLLSFETRIVAQPPIEGGETLEDFPLVFQIGYVDIDDHEQTWSHGYYVLEGPQTERHIPLELATKIDLDRWQRIFFDLRGLSPLPKQITSIVVYASGQSYQTRVANISLTTSERDALGWTRTRLNATACASERKDGSMARISVIGTGYVGLVYCTAFADLGNDVYGVDINEEKVKALQSGECPIFEPGLPEMLERNLKSGRLKFTTSYAEAVPESSFVFICVDTPSSFSGEADMRAVRKAAAMIGDHLAGSTDIVNKSTMPIGSGDLVASIVEQHIQPGATFAVVSNPEFLREGAAVHDVLHPDRIVLGSDDRTAAERVAGLYDVLDAPIVITDRRSAEMIKYASNSFLATKISFINEIAQICERVGADVTTVAKGMGYDQRIGSLFLEAGIGFGGSCFPKDVKALAYMAQEADCHPQLLRAVLEINADQRRRFVHKLQEQLGDLTDRHVGVWGLSFKQNTDDMRESPAIDIIRMIEQRGAKVKAYDPAAIENARELLPSTTFCTSPYEVVDGADALCVVTQWNEFKQADLARVAETMRTPLLLDGRNIYDPADVSAVGLTYVGVGR